VGRLGIAAVPVSLRPDALLDREDALAEPQGGIDFVGVPGKPYFQKASTLSRHMPTQERITAHSA
jgi:hypothetical protein